MTIFVNENTKVIVQGMTGSEGTKHTKRMLKAGTKIVAGVTPGKGGQSQLPELMHQLFLFHLSLLNLL